MAAAISDRIWLNRYSSHDERLVFAAKETRHYFRHDFLPVIGGDWQLRVRMLVGGPESHVDDPYSRSDNHYGRSTSSGRHRGDFSSGQVKESARSRKEIVR